MKRLQATTHRLLGVCHQQNIDCISAFSREPKTATSIPSSPINDAYQLAALPRYESDA
jgi:hypothetical protein